MPPLLNAALHPANWEGRGVCRDKEGRVSRNQKWSPRDAIIGNQKAYWNKSAVGRRDTWAEWGFCSLL